MAAKFKIFGPFDIPYSGEYHRFIQVGCPAFWNSTTSHLAKERGCYVFAIRASRGFRPVYVGKTKKSFEKECFTNHKIAQHYAPALDIARGTPVLFFVVLDKKKGPVNNRAISQVESFLIHNAVAKNPELSNVHGTKKEEWSITGVIRGGKGKCPQPASVLPQLEMEKAFVR